MNWSFETKMLLAMVGGTLLVVFGIAFLLGKGGTTSSTGTIDQKILIRDDSHVLGKADARVTIVEFSDFQCPACKTAQPMVSQILKKYPDQVRFVYRHYPLPQHEFSQVAAQAAEAAGAQNKFWEMLDVLFERSPDLSKEKLFGYAKDLGLNMDQFTRDFESSVVSQKIVSDRDDGNKTNLDSTQTFFINGSKLKSGIVLDEFVREINTRL